MQEVPVNLPEDSPERKPLKSTLNLPQTAFPMKANLPQNEPHPPRALATMRLYDQIRAARAGSPSYILHDGPPYANGAIHLGHALNKCLKDFVVKSSTMAGFDAPYVPGWDCHGLPIEIKVDEQLGRKKLEMDPLAGPPRLPRVRAKVPRPPALPVRAHRRLRPLGQPLLHHGHRLRGPHRRDLLRTSSRRASSTRASSPSTGASTTAPRSPKPKSSTRSTPAPASTSATNSPATPRRLPSSLPSPARTSTPSSGPPPPGPSPPPWPSPSTPSLEYVAVHSTEPGQPSTSSPQALLSSVIVHCSLMSGDNPTEPPPVRHPRPLPRQPARTAPPSSTRSSTATSSASSPTTSPPTRAPEPSTPRPPTA